MPPKSKFPQMTMHLGVLGTPWTPNISLFTRGVCLGVSLTLTYFQQAILEKNVLYLNLVMSPKLGLQ